MGVGFLLCSSLSVSPLAEVSLYCCGPRCGTSLWQLPSLDVLRSRSFPDVGLHLRCATCSIMSFHLASSVSSGSSESFDAETRFTGVPARAFLERLTEPHWCPCMSTTGSRHSSCNLPVSSHVHLMFSVMLRHRRTFYLFHM